MTFKKVETPGLEPVSIQTGPDWKGTHHRLFNVSPEVVPNVQVVGAGVTVWDLCFLEDLLQAVNHSKGLLLDVGWYPHADPSGSYRLQVVRPLRDKKRGRSPYDWSQPIRDERTRSLMDLLDKIHKVVNE